MRFVPGTLALALVVGSSLSLAAASRAVDVPWSGQATGAVVDLVPTADGVILTLHADGVASHLGQFTRVETIEFNPATGALAGSMTMTAANGDQLNATVAGGFISATDATGTYDVTGGTGRFQGATGSATFALSSPDGVNFKVSFQGTLAR
jgi:hypothetical protein